MQRRIIQMLLASLLLSACNLGVNAPQDANTLSTAAALTVEAALTSAAVTPLASPVPGVAIDGTTAEPPSSECEENYSIVRWERDGVNYDKTEVDKALAPKTGFVMTWELQNTGTCVWDDSYKMIFESGERLTTADSFPVMPFGYTVRNGETLTINIQMTAPSTPGLYESAFSLVNGEGKNTVTTGVLTTVGSSGSVTGTLAAPGNLRYEYSCVPGTVTFTLFWVDKSSDEKGFRIYRDGNLVADIGAGSTTYVDIVPAIGTYEYFVAAYNPSGEARSRVSATTTNCQ